MVKRQFRQEIKTAGSDNGIEFNSWNDYFSIMVYHLRRPVLELLNKMGELRGNINTL